jgi:hypothetical protein
MSQGPLIEAPRPWGHSAFLASWNKNYMYVESLCRPPKMRRVPCGRNMESLARSAKLSAESWPSGARHRRREKRKLSAESFDPPRATRAWNLSSLPTRLVVTAMTMGHLQSRPLSFLLQHFLLLCPKAMALFKFWWFLMSALPRLTLIGFCGAQNRACMLAAVFW